MLQKPVNASIIETVTKTKTESKEQQGE